MISHMASICSSVNGGLAPKSDGWEPGDPREMATDEQVAAEWAVITEC